MRLYYKIYFSLTICSLLFLTSCLKDNISVTPVDVSEDGAQILTYLEENGDYINTSQVPSLVDAQELNSNLSNYLILDIREESVFQNGHIHNAVNIKPEDLLIYLENNGINYPKIVIVSASGQAAGYYTSLIRLAGYNNVFSLNYGMASWNNNFSQIWFSGINNTATEDYFDNDAPPQPEFNNLPDIDLPTGSNSLKERIKDRISILLKEKFDEYASESNSNELTVKFSPISYDSNNYFIVCYGPIELYYTSTLGENSVPGHIPGSYLFRSTPPFFDLRSSRLLQTLPPDKPILIYSLDGQLSAYIAAYLRLLGYDVKSILFGAHSLYYDALIKIPEFRVFSSAEVNNYSFEQ